jgi:alkylation response protein AidB-like acyl-CoA dehydrogenase
MVKIPATWRRRWCAALKETLVDFALTDEQEMLKALTERFASGRGSTGAYAAGRASDGGFSAGNWTQLAQMGLLSVPFAETHGGLGGDLVDIITVMEALGRGLVAEPVLNEIMLAGRLLESGGTPTQIAHWLPRLTGGSAHLALAHAEHGTRYRVDRCATRFAHGRLTGHKTNVPAQADCMIVTAEADDGLSLALIERGTAGVQRREYRLVDGSVASELQFSDAVAEPMPGGLPCLLEVVQGARIAASAEMIGLASLLFETTLDYVRQRYQFGAPIGSFQAIQHRLADLYAALELARSQLYRCILTAPAERDVAVAAAKSFISSVALRIGEEAIQMHGGMGVSDELSIGHAHKRVLVLAQMFGDAAHELARYNRATAATPARAAA